MQSEWLRQYFMPGHQAHCQHECPEDTADALPLEEPEVSRRNFVKGSVVAGMAAGMAASGVAGTTPQAEAQEAKNILGDKWWPSPWGPADEAGASNRITPEKVLQAAKLIKKGKIYRLGMDIEAGIPLFALDLRNAPPWLREERPTRQIGAVFATESESNFIARLSMPAIFDGILFVENTSAARPNGRR